MINDYFHATNKYEKIFVSGVDAYNSFTVMCEKKERVPAIHPDHARFKNICG